MKDEYFIIGSAKVPEWVQEGLRSGKINKIHDDENEETYFKITSATKDYILYNGDVIVKSKHGLVGLPKEKAAHIIKPVVKKEEKENE